MPMLIIALLFKASNLYITLLVLNLSTILMDSMLYLMLFMPSVVPNNLQVPPTVPPGFILVPTPSSVTNYSKTLLPMTSLPARRVTGPHPNSATHLPPSRVAVSLTLAHSFSPKLPSACTAGVPTLLSLPSYNLTAKTASKSVKVPTSTSSNLTNTTLAHPTPVLTCIPSLSDPKNTSHPALATSPELTTLPFSSSFLTTVSPVLPPPRSASMLSTTMFSV